MRERGLEQEDEWNLKAESEKKMCGLKMKTSVSSGGWVGGHLPCPARVRDSLISTSSMNTRHKAYHYVYLI